jgi:hypothetical protein
VNVTREDRRRAWLANEEHLGPLPPELAEPSCERCNDREARLGSRLCRQCNDDDDAAMLAAYMCVG